VAQTWSTPEVVNDRCNLLASVADFDGSGSMPNPDVWEPVVRRYYDLAKLGARVDSLVVWWEDFQTYAAFGQVQAYEDVGGIVMGLKGLLNEFQLGDWATFEPMEMQITKPGPPDAFAEVTIVSTAKERTLDDPVANPPGSPTKPGWSAIAQDWWQGPLPEATLTIWLVNVWEWRHLGPIFRSVQEIEAEG
jgi:hypothetical protein